MARPEAAKPAKPPQQRLWAAADFMRGYPPDAEARAVELVLEQAALFAAQPEAAA